jgi:hypothetical protein
MPVERSVAVCPTRAARRLGPFVTVPVALTSTVSLRTLPEASTPPATQIDPDGRSTAVWSARESGRVHATLLVDVGVVVVLLFVVEAGAVDAAPPLLLLLLPPPPQPARSPTIPGMPRTSAVRPILVIVVDMVAMKPPRMSNPR